MKKFKFGIPVEGQITVEVVAENFEEAVRKLFEYEYRTVEQELDFDREFYSLEDSVEDIESYCNNPEGSEIPKDIHYKGSLKLSRATEEELEGLPED